MIDYIARARQLRKIIELAAAYLSDETALEAVELYPHWKPDIAYNIGERLEYSSKLYRVVQAHTSQEGWEPDKVPALFTEVARPGEIPEWKQPTGAQDAYMAGDKVRYNERMYESLIDNNIWSPEAYPAGWKKIGE